MAVQINRDETTDHLGQGSSGKSRLGFLDVAEVLRNDQERLGEIERDPFQLLAGIVKKGEFVVTIMGVERDRID
jgi:hypothetical protein